MSDSIEKRIELAAPVSRVWRALTDFREFGEWFRVKLDGPFVPGQVARGHIAYPGYEHVRWEATVPKMELERLFSFTWHPYAVDPAIERGELRPERRVEGRVRVRDRVPEQLVLAREVVDDACRAGAGPLGHVDYADVRQSLLPNQLDRRRQDLGPADARRRVCQGVEHGRVGEQTMRLRRVAPRWLGALTGDLPTSDDTQSAPVDGVLPVSGCSVVVAVVGSATNSCEPDHVAQTQDGSVPVDGTVTLCSIVASVAVKNEIARDETRTMSEKLP